MEQKKIILPEGWEIDKVEGNEIILKESKKELPKTWEECLKEIGRIEYIGSDSDIATLQLPSTNDNYKNSIPISLDEPMLALCQLLICREVYRQGWKPDWNDNSQHKYCIENLGNSIRSILYHSTHRILSFQSGEVRDEFLENFRDLIEEAKELI